MKIDFLGIDTDTMDKLEFQEIIPGIKLPDLPLPIAGVLDKLPVLPGFKIKDPVGNVIGEGMKIPTPFENAPADDAETLAGGQYYAQPSSYEPDLYEEPAALGNMSAAEMEFAELELGVSAESVVDVDLDEEELEI
jgi:hypothetical protein